VRFLPLLFWFPHFCPRPPVSIDPLGLRPKDERVDTAIWLRGTDRYGAEALVLSNCPWHPVLTDASFDCVYDCVRYPLVNVRFRCGILVCRHRVVNSNSVFRDRTKLVTWHGPDSALTFDSLQESNARTDVMLARKPFAIQALFCAAPGYWSGVVVGMS